MFLSETGLRLSIRMKKFTIPGYSLWIIKQDPQNRHRHRVYGDLGAYIKNGLPCDTQKTKTMVSHWFFFRVTLIHGIFTLYRLQYYGILMFDNAKRIDNILSNHLSASIHICDDFNEEWWVHSNTSYEDTVRTSSSLTNWPRLWINLPVFLT